MPAPATILPRLLKASLFALVLIVAAALPGRPASAHGALHGAGTSATGESYGTGAATAAGTAVLRPAGMGVFAELHARDVQPEDGCPGGGHGHPGHLGCCAGGLGCSVACAPAIALTDVPDLARPTGTEPPLASATLSNGVGSGPPDHPPRPFA